MEVDTADLPAHLVEADVVEALEARAVDRPNSVVRDQEVFLPPHEDVLPLIQVLDHCRPALFRLLEVRPEGGELVPVVEIDLLAGAPSLVLGDEAVFRANDLALKVCRERGVVVGQA